MLHRLQAKKDGIDFYKPRPLFLQRIVLHGAPNVDGKGGVDGYFVVTSKSRELEYNSRTKNGTQRIAGAGPHSFDVRCVVDKDVKLQWMKNDPKEKKEKLTRVFHVWFNTHFVQDHHLKFTLADGDIDGVKKTHKLYPGNFAVEFFFEAEGAENAE